MNPVFGIHVGNSRACLAVCKQDDSKFSVEVIANNAGDRVMPAIVTVTENENVVGAACKSLMTTRWNSTVTYNKLMLNKDSPDAPSNGERRVATEMHDGELCYSMPLDGRTDYVTPTEIATCIYRCLFEMARSAVPGVDGDISCVLLVPKHFSEAARFKVRTAAEAVGWDVLHIVNEPAAALLGFNMLSEKVPPPAQTVVVYRVGGRSCDVSVIDVTHGMISILDTEYSEEVNGKLLISSLTKYLADEFYRKYKLDPKESHRSLTKLTLAAEECLHVLSTIESANCFVESLCDGVDLSYTMSRARFDSLLFPFLSDFARPLHTVLARTNLTPDKVNTVLLCGGLLKVPRLKKFISDIFQESCTKVMSLPNGVNYDEVLACGAARQAGYIAVEKLGDSFLPSEIDIPTMELPVVVMVEGAECKDQLHFEPGQPLPLHRTLTLTHCSKVVTVSAVQLEKDVASSLGQLRLKDPNDTLVLEMEIDGENGIRIEITEAPDVVKHHTLKMFAPDS